MKAPDQWPQPPQAAQPPVQSASMQLPGITTDTRYLWLMLMQQGGWWTPADIARYWHPTWTVKEVEMHLLCLHKHGFVERKEHALFMKWSVTDNCSPLPGLVIKEPRRMLS